MYQTGKTVGGCENHQIVPRLFEYLHFHFSVFIWLPICLTIHRAMFLVSFFLKIKIKTVYALYFWELWRARWWLKCLCMFVYLDMLFRVQCVFSSFMANHMTHPKSYIVLQFVWQWNLYLIKVKKNNIFLLFNAFILTQIWGSGNAYKLHQVA